MSKLVIRTHRRFLPFHEARDYARSLGFKETQQWKEWAKTDQRPSYIPYCPWRAYKGEFQSFPDFLGYTSRGDLRDLHQHLSPSSSNDQYTTRAEGVQMFADLVARYASGFEVRPFYHYSTTSFLLRTTNSGDNDKLSDDWTSLVVRAAKINVNGTIQFRHMRKASFSTGVFAIDLSHNRLYAFPPASVLPDTVNISPGRSKYDCFRIDPQGLQEILAKQYMESTKRAQPDWLVDGLVKKDDILWASAVGQVWRTMYTPLHLDVGFGMTNIGTPYNIVIEGYPTLHKTVSMHHTRFLYVHTYRNINAKIVTIAADDHLSFVVATICNDGGRVIGLYLFPKEVLVERAILRNLEKQRSGVRNLYLFPPLEGPWRELPERVLKKHEWKNEFFIDLREFADIEESRKRFLEIFTNYRPNKGVSEILSGTNRRFLPFQEARNYARTLGFTQSRHWYAWAKTKERPPYIPSAPNTAYAGEFLNFADFLGYPTRGELRDLKQSLNSSLPLASISRIEGLQIFSDLVADYAPEIEMQCFSNDSPITFLMRPKNHDTDSADTAEWVPLMVRTAGIHKRGTIQFADMKCEDYVPGVFGVDLPSRDIYFFPRNSKLPPTITIGRIQSRYHEFRVGNESLQEVLRSHLRSSSSMTQLEWFNTGYLNPSDRVWGKCMGQVCQSMFRPLNLSISFQISALGASHNVLIDGVPVLQKCSTKHRSGKLSVNAYRSWGGKSVALAASDTLDFLLIMVQGEAAPLIGLYLIPKSALVERRVVRNVDKQLPGCRNLYLMPPVEGPWSALSHRIAKTHEWKNEFFIDLTKLAYIEESRKRFLEIFTKYRTPRVAS